MSTILSIDPGLRTGIALGHYDESDALYFFRQEDVKGGAQGMIEWIHYSIPGALTDHVVMENFIPREGKHGVGTDASEVIGAVRFWAYLNLIPVTFQPPAGRKKAVPDTVLARFGTYVGNEDRNIKEAARHAVWYLKNRGHKPTIKKGWLDG